MTPDNILAAPANDFVREFIGSHRLIQNKPSAKLVDDVMIKPITISMEKSIDDAILTMVKRRVDTLFVVDGKEHLRGMITVEAITTNRNSTDTVSDVMTTDISAVHTGTKLQDTVRRILRRNLNNIPVIDEERHLVGLVTRANIVDIVYDTIWGDEETEKAE